MASPLHAFWKRMHSGKALIKKKSVLSATSPSIGKFYPLKNHAIMQRNKKDASFFTQDEERNY
jgi:hypothetical protein